MKSPWAIPNDPRRFEARGDAQMPGWWNELAGIDSDDDARCSCGGTFVFDRDTCETRCDRCGTLEES